MVDATEYFEYWRGRIERDLLPFVDPGADLQITGDKRALSAHWVARGHSYDATFTLSLDGGVQVGFKGQSLAYRAFLACPELADLLGLAKMILQAQPPKLFVPTRARRSDDAEAAAAPAVDLLRQLLEGGSEDLTKIVMVTGEAGAGKTRVLQELVKDQALLYQRGRTECLYLYVNAQGRALARFNEALATELQDLRAVLTYHAVSALVRVGVLVPIIDGFDELLGVGGYDDAFSSLTGFIEELDGQGQLVASARSTYYEQEFVARASTVSALGSQAWTQLPVEVMPWEDGEFREFVRLYTASGELTAEQSVALPDRVAAIFSGRNAHLRRKPLFVARTMDILRRDPEFLGGDDLLADLVRAYLERERREKLLDRQGGTLLTSTQVELLFKTLAEEMWNQETRELDRRSVREVAEFVLVTEGLPEAVQRVVVERMPQLAFLVPGERLGGVSFEHEMFFSYFLAQVFREKVGGDRSAVRVFLSRSVLPAEVAVTALAALDRERPLSRNENAQPLMDRLAEACLVETPRTSQVRENAGLVVQVLLKTAASRGPLSGLRVWRVVLPGGDLRGVELSQSRIENVEFRRVDLSTTRLVQCRADGILLTEVIVDPQCTRLELEGLDAPNQIVGLRVRDRGLIKGLYDPNEVQSVLVACGAVPAPAANAKTDVRPVSASYARLLEKLAKAYRRTNPVCTADDNLRGLFRDPHWENLERLLVRHGIVTRETRRTSGPAKTFLRRQFLPEQVMAGAQRGAMVPPEIRAFWEELEGVSAS